MGEDTSLLGNGQVNCHKIFPFLYLLGDIWFSVIKLGHMQISACVKSLENVLFNWM